MWNSIFFSNLFLFKLHVKDKLQKEDVCMVVYATWEQMTLQEYFINGKNFDSKSRIFFNLFFLGKRAEVFSAGKRGHLHFMRDCIVKKKDVK